MSILSLVVSVCPETVYHWREKKRYPLMQRDRLDRREEIVPSIGPLYVHDLAVFGGKTFTHRAYEIPCSK
jgi:hypothetical protein